MFKGAKPAAQPRTLRTIAETKGTVPAGFDGGVEYVPQAGAPVTEKGAGQVYQDVADQSKAGAGAAGRGATAADPSPFNNVRRGR